MQPSTNTLQEQAYQGLWRMILAGQLNPQDRLSTRQVAKEFGLGITPVREAILKLRHEGVLRQVPQSGTYLRQVTRRELEQAFDIREAMEGYTARMAAGRATPKHLRRLFRICDVFRRLAKALDKDLSPEAQVKAFRIATKADLRFHETLIAAAGNPLAEKIVQTHQVLTAYSAYNKSLIQKVSHSDMVTSYSTHTQIAKLIETRQTDAAGHEVASHVRQARESILKRFDKKRAETGGSGEAMNP